MRMAESRAWRTLVLKGMALLIPLGAARGQSGDTRGLQLVTPEGHTDGITAVSFSPDDRYVLTASADRTARLWDRETGRQVRRFVHPGPVLSAAFSPDGTRVVAGDSAGSARVWDLATGRELRTIADNAGLRAVNFSRDGRRIWTVNSRGLIRSWDVETGSPVATFGDSIPRGIGRATFSADGRFVATIWGRSFDATASVWNLETKVQVLRVPYRSNGTAGLALSPDGTQLFIGIHFIDIATGDTVDTLSTEYLGRGAAYSADGSRLATSSADQICHWKLPRNQNEGSDFCYNNGGSTVLELAFSHRSGQLLSAEGDKAARLWNGKSLSQTYRGRSQLPFSARFAGRGRWIASTVFLESARVWDITTGRDAAVLGKSDRIEITEDRRFIAARRLDEITIADSTGRKLCQYVIDDYVRNMAIFPLMAYGFVSGGPRLAVVFLGGVEIVPVHNTGTYHLNARDSGLHFLRSLPYAGGTSVSRDGQTVLSYVGRIRTVNTRRVGIVQLDMWNAVTGDSLRTLVLEGAADLTSAVFSPDGRSIVALSKDSLWVLDAISGARKFGIAWPIVDVNRLPSASADRFAISPDGRLLATGGEDGVVRVWRLAGGEQLGTLQGHTTYIRSVDFSPDGRYLATASQDHATIIWDVAKRQELVRRYILEDDNWVAVTPDGRFDGTPAGIALLHFQQELRTIPMEEMSRLHTPGLLGIALRQP